MAYDAKTLSRLGGVPYAAGDSKSVFGYATADSIATVIASGYFNNATKRLRKGDVIIVIAAIGGTPATTTIVVTSATNAATVTTAKESDPGGVAGGQTLAATTAAALTGTPTGTVNGALVDVVATAAATVGGATPTAAQVDTGIALAVSTIVTGVNEQNAEFKAAINEVVADNAALRAVLVTAGLITA